jgi:hypothetical protein
MSELEFHEQMRIIGTVMGYTTAFLFLGWAIYTLTKMWLEHITNTARARSETYHEQYERVQRDTSVKDYEAKHGKYNAYWYK